MAKLRKDRDSALFALDVVMLALIISNLALILFEWIYVGTPLRGVLEDAWPSFYRFYEDTIHEHFFWIDLAFVAVFLAELLGQWIAAIIERRYHRWFFYPFIHWYDVLGCIPIASFRFFRVLRVVSMVFKMQRLELIDLTQTGLYRTFDKYRGIMTEEISDRVVVNVLTDLQNEIEEGSPVVDRIMREVVEPKREMLVAAASERLQKATRRTHALYRHDAEQYIERRIAEAVEQNEEIGLIAQMPVVGERLSVLLERAISDITFHVVNDLVEDLGRADNNPVVGRVAEISVNAVLQDGREDLETTGREAVIEALELVKEQVKVQQWKQREREQALEETEVLEGRAAYREAPPERVADAAPEEGNAAPEGGNTAPEEAPSSNGQSETDAPAR
jgi:hypothetical protein